jgi:hypothetical protein
MTYDDLDAKVRQQRQEPLHQLAARLMGDEEWDEEAFRESVSGTLSAGAFKLVIAIDEMDPGLSRIIKYVSDQSQGKLVIFGLEMRYHKQGEIEAIIPSIANRVSPDARGAQQRKRDWNADQFRAELHRGDDHRAQVAALDLLDFAEANEDGLNWGQSPNYGSLGYRVSLGGKVISLFTLYTTGDIALNLNSLHGKVPEETFNSFVEQISMIPGFESVHEYIHRYPQYKIAQTLSEESARQAFKQTVLELKSRLRSPT